MPHLTPRERAELDALLQDAAPDEWTAWLPALFERSVRAGFAHRHQVFWDWLWAIEDEHAPRPFVGIWPRGGGKTSSAELGCVALGVRGRVLAVIA